ncbi:MAG: DUF3795 domain-containing protein [Methanospirillum sp.]
MDQPFDERLIAPCGMNCGVCKAYLRERNTCHGCFDAEQNLPKSRASCRMRLCERRTGPFCSDCAEFPCDRLRRMDARYRARYGMSEIENLACIRDEGMETFLDRERRRWVSDEGVLCVHDGRRYPLPGDERGPSP